MRLEQSFTLSVSGDGYAEFRTSEGGVYIHRLSAVAEHGVEKVKDMDVHHEVHQWVNNPTKLTPEDPVEHRKRTLEGVEGGEA